MKPEKVRRFLNQSLKKLQMDYVDLYLIHTPIGVEGKNDTDFFPLDDQGRLSLDLNTDIIAVWKVRSHPSWTFLLPPVVHLNSLRISFNLSKTCGPFKWKVNECAVEITFAFSPLC